MMNDAEVIGFLKERAEWLKIIRAKNKNGATVIAVVVDGWYMREQDGERMAAHFAELTGLKQLEEVLKTEAA